MTHIVYLSLGSNIGNRRRALEEALEHLTQQVGTIERQSSIIETKPWGYESPNDFLNMVVCCSTTLAPRQVLETIWEIEKTMGRTLKTDQEGYHDRIIDIDILMYDNLKIDQPDLQIPHPKMQERDFVMIPLKEIYLT